MFGLGVPELLIIGVILVMLFGVRKLPEVGSSVGKAINNFRKAADGKEMTDIEARKEAKA